MSALWADVARDGDGGVAAMGHACRAVRLLQLIRLLRDRWYSVAELADALSVSPRTVRRDLLDMQDEPLRLPLCEARGRWRMMRTADRF